MMKKVISIACALALSIAISAQSLSTGIQYLGAAASANASKQQRAQANGENQKNKVAFQMDIEISGRARWGIIPTSSTGITYSDGGSISFLSIGGNNTLTGGPAANVDLGVRLNDSYFIGIGAQFEANFGNTNASLGTMRNNVPVRIMNLCLPIYGLVKIYVPSANEVSPYFDFGIGGYLPEWYRVKTDLLTQYELEIPRDLNLQIEGDKLIYQADKGGFYLHAAAGVDMNHFQVSAGYELSTYTENANTRLYHNLFLKMGVRIGG